MDDYKGIFAQEFAESVSAKKPRSKQTYLISIINRETEEVFWTGTVQASSHKNAQTQFRKEYSEVRSKYDQSYCLNKT